MKTWTADPPTLDSTDSHAGERPPPIGISLVASKPAAQSTTGTPSMSLPQVTQSTSSVSCTVAQPLEVSSYNGSQISATQDNFITPQTSQSLVEGLTVDAGPSQPVATVSDTVLPTLVQAAVSSASTVLSSNPAITITPTPNTTLLQPGLVMDEQNLQWILNETQKHDQSVSIYNTVQYV